MQMLRKNSPPRLRTILMFALAFVLAASATLFAVTHFVTGHGSFGPKGDIHTIKHIVIIMQENRSFDSYFGTYPGADGMRPPHLTLHAVGGFKLAKVRGPDGLKMLQILANFWGIRYP